MMQNTTRILLTASGFLFSIINFIGYVWCVSCVADHKIGALETVSTKQTSIDIDLEISWYYLCQSLHYYR